MSAFVHGEVELAAATGLHVKKLQAARIRHLKQGEHWDLFEQRVAYSPAGLAAVLEKTAGQALDLPALRQLEVKTLLVPPQDKTVGAILAKLTKFYPNPYRVQITLPDGKTADLRIKNAKNFRRGMTMPVRLNDKGLYELTRREPRFPGKW